MKVVPSLKNVAWMGDFGECVDEEEKDESKVYEMDETFEGESTVCTSVKVVSGRTMQGQRGGCCNNVQLLCTADAESTEDARGA